MVKELSEHFEAGKQLARLSRTRCSTRTSGSPRATGSRASSSTCRSAPACPPRSSRGGSTTACSEHAQDLGAADELEGVARPAGARQRGLPAAQGLRGEPRLQRAFAGHRGRLRALVRQIRRDGALRRRRLDVPHVERPGPLPRLQELWRRGVSVHHGVPVLRHADPEARAQARSRRRARAPRKRARSRPQLPRLRPGEIPGIRADRRPWAVWLLVARLGASSPSGIKSGLLTLDDFQLRRRRRRPVARVHDAVRLHVAPATRSSPSARSRCSAGCSSAATAGGRRCSSSW